MSGSEWWRFSSGHGAFSGCDSGEPQGARIERVTSGVVPHLLKLLAISRHRHAMAPLFWGDSAIVPEWEFVLYGFI
jgi:hypothetical protein